VTPDRTKKESPRVISPREDVALIEGYYSPQLDVDVRLNTNEAPEPPPPGFLKAVEEEFEAIALNRYPDRGAHELREAIAAFHGVDASQVYCANGSNEVLQSILLAYGGSGRVAVTFEPTYAMHAHIARVTGTTVISGERDEKFAIDKEEFERVLKAASGFGEENPAVSFICSPNNPTGQIEAKAIISFVLERAPGLVVVDEAYGQFAPRSALEDFAGSPNLVVVRTFSKTWSLAALRLGYAITTPKIVGCLEAVTLPYHLDALKQAAGRVALRYDAPMRGRVSRLVEERGHVTAELLDLGVSVCPSDANFVLIRPNAKKTAREIWEALLERSVLVRDVSSWPRLSGYLRVTIGTREENEAFLRALREVLLT
jgi:histidinol-phosphate aminotransferase